MLISGEIEGKGTRFFSMGKEEKQLVESVKSKVISVKLKL